MTAMMELVGKRNGLDRLIEMQTVDLEESQRKIDLWKQYKTDYVALKNLLSEIGDKVRHPHRLPIAGSQLAFVDSHIIHTNEITVLLGDNYFALRSTKQASAVIDRRLANIEENLKMNIQAKKKTEDWLKAVKEHKHEKEELVEIIETS